MKLVLLLAAGALCQPDAVEELLRTKPRSFEHAVIYRVSVAAAPLAAWVKVKITS